MLLDRKGQMTVELCVVLPIAIAIALVVANAMTFFGTCAEFDREARNAIRVFAASPSANESTDQILEEIRVQIESSVDDENVDVSVSLAGVEGAVHTYEAKATFHPTLFGMGLRDSLFGVPTPSLEHSTRLAVEPYRPGVLL